MQHPAPEERPLSKLSQKEVELSNPTEFGMVGTVFGAILVSFMAWAFFSGITSHGGSPQPSERYFEETTILKDSKGNILDVKVDTIDLKAENADRF